MFIKGSKTCNTITTLLNDLTVMKKPEAICLKKRNPLHPFDDIQSIEFLSQKNDASLFAFGSHSKKRPNNLILGRFFDHHILDMVEFGVSNFKSLDEFRKAPKPVTGSKPSFLFVGSEFEHNTDFKKTANLLIDFFRGAEVDSINLAGLDHVVVCTAVDGGTVAFRHYFVALKKSGSRVPRVELVECGPSFDLVLRRQRWASEDLLKEALKVPSEKTAKKVKNIKTNDLKQTVGRVHVGRQEISKMATRKFKAFKGNKRGREGEGKADEKGAKGAKRVKA